MKLTYIKQAGEPNGDAGDQYTGLDRFGRVVDQRWPQGTSELERVDYGFTAASNRQWRQNRVASNGQDEYYNYDGLYQVAELNRGTLNSGKTAISGTPSWTEDFTYDPIGNWNNYLTKVSGVTDLDQSRTHNTANETVEIDGSDATVAHDLAGNMTTVPQVADWSSTNVLKWDAWNRLVEVVDGETTVAQYRYDGKTRRVTKETDEVRHYYYTDRWQILEERIDDETTADRQFVWGQRYLDDLVLRDRDVDADGSLDERLYVLSDYFNPTAIADEDGVVVERYGYNAFGLSRVMDADFEPRSTSDFDWETRYGAYRWDAETGFYQVRFRYLHPTLGRWLSRDPIGESAGVNIYLYVLNNPALAIDALGLDPATAPPPPRPPGNPPPPLGPPPLPKGLVIRFDVQDGGSGSVTIDRQLTSAEIALANKAICFVSALLGTSLYTPKWSDFYLTSLETGLPTNGYTLPRPGGGKIITLNSGAVPQNASDLSSLAAFGAVLAHEADHYFTDSLDNVPGDPASRIDEPAAEKLRVALNEKLGPCHFCFNSATGTPYAIKSQAEQLACDCGIDLSAPKKR